MEAVSLFGLQQFLSPGTGRPSQISARRLCLLSFQAGGSEGHAANFSNALGSALKNVFLTSAVTTSCPHQWAGACLCPEQAAPAQQCVSPTATPKASHIPSPPSATAPGTDISSLTISTGSGQKAAYLALGYQAVGPQSPGQGRTERKSALLCSLICRVLSRLLERLLTKCNTLAVGFGETACSNYRLS